MKYVDAHCHVDLYEHPVAELEEAEACEVGVLAVTNAPFVFRSLLEMMQNRTDVWVAVGLHPELAGRYIHQLDQFKASLNETRFVGEVGLDYRVTEPSSHTVQRKVFESILDECRKRADTVVSIHSRGAEEDVVSMIGESFPGKTILHWYSGAKKHLMRAQSNGSFFSVNASMIRSTKGSKLVESMSRSRVLTESDGPFAKVRGKRAKPSEMPSTVAALAEMWGGEVEATRAMIASNWDAVLS